jgi:hypothetical protein
MTSFQSGSVVQPCELLCGADFPPRPSSFTSLGGGSANIPGFSGGNIIDLQQLVPARGRLGIEEIPFQGQDPVPTIVVPPPPGGWGPQATREDDLRRFDNRSTQGLDGGGRSSNITRFLPQLTQYQQPDDSARWREFDRNAPSKARLDVAYP